MNSIMDKEYWSNYYLNQRQDRQPTLFAKHIIENYIKDEHSKLIELGCGNGRDSIYFSKRALNVVAVDQVKEEIDFLQNQFNKNKNIKFISSDFCELGKEEIYDIVYSRFTLHSITSAQQSRVLNWAFNQLNEGGLFCIEVRGKKNELYKKGEAVVNEKDAYIYNDHYRRFLDYDDFCDDLKKIGFTLEYSKEAKGFAPYKNTNETFIRVIAKK
ncbi:MAG: hypothetical protein Sapg2KO_20300 [Saprospiraceae bacterium]